MASLLEETGSVPKSRKFVPALLTVGLNSLGGVVAGKLQPALAGAFPQYPWAGDVLLFAMAIGAKVVLPGAKVYEVVAREMGAGMAGWVGDDIFDLLLNTFGWGVEDFKLGVPFKMGTKVKYEGKTWRVNKDVSGTDGALPGRDSRFVPAQGIDPKDMHAFTGQLLNNEKLIATLAKAQAAVFGPELEKFAAQNAGLIELNDEARAKISTAMQVALREVAQQFHGAVGG